MEMRRPFDPLAHELDPNFRLTKYADLKGWGCKVPQDVLLKLLEGLQPDSSAQDQEQAHFQYAAPTPKVGKLEFLILGKIPYCSATVKPPLFIFFFLFNEGGDPPQPPLK